MRTSRRLQVLAALAAAAALSLAACGGDGVEGAGDPAVAASEVASATAPDTRELSVDERALGVEDLRGVDGVEGVVPERPVSLDRDSLLAGVTWPAEVEDALVGVYATPEGGEAFARFRNAGAALALRDFLREDSGGEYRDLPELPHGLLLTRDGISVVFVDGVHVHTLVAPGVEDPAIEARLIAVARNWSARVTAAGGAPPRSATPSGPADAASAEEEVRRAITAQHAAFLAGDAEAYCSYLADEIRSVSGGCAFVPAGLEHQRENGRVVETPEFLEVTIESDEVAYAAVYDQRDPQRPDARTPTDHQLVRRDGAWRISLTRYRTERESGPAKCFVGGSADDLC